MKNLSEQPCLIARSLALVGDAWSMLIMRDAHAGLTRFDEFRKSLGIVPTMLTGRLSSLTEEGLLEKRRYSERPPRDTSSDVRAPRAVATPLAVDLKTKR